MDESKGIRVGVGASSSGNVGIIVGIIVMALALVVSLGIVAIALVGPQNDTKHVQVEVVSEPAPVVDAEPDIPSDGEDLGVLVDQMETADAHTAPVVEHKYASMTSAGIGVSDSDEEAQEEEEAPIQVSEDEIYTRLGDYYRMAGDFDGRVSVCADDFNQHCFDSSYSSRRSLSRSSYNLEDEIVRAWNELAAMDVPSSSVNYGTWYDMQELYQCLWGRIDVINRAWDVSLQYDDPGKHQDEILDPIYDARGPNGNNVYYSRFNELYPRINVVRP